MPSSPGTNFIRPRANSSAQNAVILHSAIQALVIGWAGFDASYGDSLRKLFPLETAMGDSLDALILGMEGKLA